MQKVKFRYRLIIHAILILLAVSIIIPLMYVISLSVTSEEVIISGGYKLIPAEFDLEGYRTIFKNPKQLVDSYKITIEFSLLGTALSLVIMTMMAYAISRTQFVHRKAVTFFIYFTMLFSGGLIPSYIINTKYLHLGNTFWIYIFPSLVSAYHVLVLRTFFKGIPPSLMESAKIDGAREFTIFLKIVIPLSKPVLATIALLQLLAKWNDWNTSLIYIMDTDKYSLQYLLQKILRETAFLEQMAKEHNLAVANIAAEKKAAPVESMRFAMAILAAGPMMFVFPFFQKYFTKGLTIGAVKE